MSDQAPSNPPSPINDATSITDVSPIVYAAPGAAPVPNQDAKPAAQPPAQNQPTPATNPEPVAQTPQPPAPTAAAAKPPAPATAQPAVPAAQPPKPAPPAAKQPAQPPAQKPAPPAQSPAPAPPQPTPAAQQPAPAAAKPAPAAQPPAPRNEPTPQASGPPGINPASVVGGGGPNAIGAVAAARMVARTAALAGTALDTSSRPENPDGMGGIQRHMLQLVSEAESKEELLESLATAINGSLPTLQMVYAPRDEEGNLSKLQKIGQAQQDGNRQLSVGDCLTACRLTCQTGKLITQSIPNTPTMIIAAPVPLRGSDPEAIGIVFPNTESARLIMMLTQMLVSQTVLWHVMGDSRQADIEARDSSAVVELLDHVTDADTSRHACYTLAAELEAYLHSTRVAIGLKTGDKGSCQLSAISGVARFDKRSQTVRAFEAAMDEAVFRDTVVRWPADDDAQRLPALAHKRLCSMEDSDGAVSTPIHDRDGQAVGAILILADDADALDSSARFLELAESPLATAIMSVKRHEGGSMARIGRGIGDFWSGWKGKLSVAVVAGLVAAMWIPLPYKISCDCQIEPVTRRFVAAPFEGTLEKSLVRPGDMVEAGEVLARMDGREIRWKRAGVDADLQQAIKKRDAAQASHNYAEQQISRLEAERLKLELQLLDHRAENLEIKSPISGIVASGDLERAEGAPLTIGQSMFEIAPLEKMIVEVSLPDDEISHIAVDQKVDVRLDAYPGQSWKLNLQKVQPRAETRERNNVFIAEAELDNSDARLRPGMKGRAKVRTPNRKIGWILFHKPYEYITKKLLW